MEEKICPVCGEESDSGAGTVNTCSKCQPLEKGMMEKENPEREVYLSTRDYSAPENYPGY